jgi:hypothetical protein
MPKKQYDSWKKNGWCVYLAWIGDKPYIGITSDMDKALVRLVRNNRLVGVSLETKVPIGDIAHAHDVRDYLNSLDIYDAIELLENPNLPALVPRSLPITWREHVKYIMDRGS